MKNYCILFLCVLVGVISAMAEVPFNGLILNNELKPVKNVKVYVKNPKRYARSDKHGRFGLTDVQPDDTLTLLLPKKRTVRIPVDGKAAMKIVLANDGTIKSEYDEEIANTGFGYVKRREFTGVSSGISGERLRSSGQRDVLGALKGMVPGLSITGSRGNYTVIMRGGTSITQSNTPLFLVDGVQVSSLDYVSIYDVDHVEVIKDASQYGAQGANGAILVTTKTGK